MNNLSASDIIKKLNLEPLPEEGGFYRETYRDDKRIPSSKSDQLGTSHSYSTCIYYLITPEEFSGLHAVKSTEIFHFYCGDPVEMIQIKNDHSMERIKLGNNLENNERPQVIVKPYIWQGTRLVNGGKWALLGCTVSPGFEFSDFITANRSELIEKFPKYSEEIKLYTHQ